MNPKSMPVDPIGCPLRPSLFLMCFESHVPWLFFAMPLGVLSLLFTVISIRKREPKRRSLRNVVLALFLILFYPAALVFISLFVMSQGG